MATIASAQAGNWGTAATWTGGVVPAIADTAAVNHQIVIDANYSVGAIDPTSTGSLIGTGFNSPSRLAVGGGQVCYIAKGITLQ